MKKWLSLIVALAVLQAIPGTATAHSPEKASGDNWLMMVKTRNTDPARDAEFNHWYNTVDIPDVLEVPGYMRARRARGQSVDEAPATAFQPDEGHYVALYSIKTDDMDKTIIDMLMASWGMEKKHRSTDLLKVTERVYYYQYAPAYHAGGAAPTGKNTYLYVAKIKCCKDKADQKTFDEWYNTSYLPALKKVPGLVTATRYKLYRVLMVKPPYIPGFLNVYEIRADSANEAMANLKQAEKSVAGSKGMSPLYVEDGSRLYQQIKDARRK